MFSKFAIVLMPLGFFLLAWKNRGPGGRFAAAGATSPDTARKCQTVGIKHDRVIAVHVESGLLRKTEDGRYYVDLEVYASRRRRAFVIAGVGALLGGAALAWLLLG